MEDNFINNEEESLKETIENIKESTEDSTLNKLKKEKSFKEKLKETDKKNNSAWQFFKFLLCAASAGIIQFVTFTILQTIFKKTGTDQTLGTMWFFQDGYLKTTFIATTCALVLSILWNFTLNRKFTFKAANNLPLAMVLAFCFYIPFYPFQTWYVGTIEQELFKYTTTNAIWPGLIAEGTVMIINFVLEFLWQKFVVFRKPKRKSKKEDLPLVETETIEEKITDKEKDK